MNEDQIVDVWIGLKEYFDEVAALSLEQVQRWLEGKQPKKVVFVPGRMINLVV